MIHTIGVFGQTAGLPDVHRPVMERKPKKVKRDITRPESPPQAQRLAAKQARKAEAAKAKPSHYDWMVQPATEDETWFRHHNWEARRALVRKSLVYAGSSEMQMDRFDNCGSDCLIEWSESEQRYRLRANHCKCRHCGPCQKAKGSLLSQNLKTKLEAGPADGCRFRFITLTLKHTPGDSLIELLKKLYDCFKRLRQTELWKASQDGGASILECKWSKAGGWHPHLHIIAEGGWLKDEKMRKEWHRITGDSFKADIRALNDIKDVCYYVAKYVGKGVNDEVWSDPEAAAEYIIGMKGVRFCATFGKWRGFALLKPDKAHDAQDWQPVALLTQIAERARRNDLAAIELLRLLDEALVYNPHKKRNATKCSDSTA